MSTTAWRFGGTEGADEAVFKLVHLDRQDLIQVQDVAVIRWPQYAPGPQALEHVAGAASKGPTLAKLRKSRIEKEMVEAVKSDMSPGTSALVLLSSDAAIDTVAEAFQGSAMELMRSDLSVPQEDQLRMAFSGQR